LNMRTADTIPLTSGIYCSKLTVCGSDK
jgi:hypothetical protein